MASALNSPKTDPLMIRIFLAGLAGAVLMFLWTFVAHMVLPLGQAGMKELPGGSNIMETMQANLQDNSGLYRLPGFGLGANPTREQQGEAMKHMNERMAKYPSGMLVYHPPGLRPFTMGRWLLTEFLTELLEALIVVGLLAQTRITSFVGRVAFIFFAGVMVAFGTNVSYWNWDGFPASYTAAYIVTQIVGFLCVGIVAGLVLGKPVQT
jgi:hypothetical protein